MKEGDMVTLVSGKFKLSTSDPNTFTSTTPAGIIICTRRESLVHCWVSIIAYCLAMETE